MGSYSVLGHGTCQECSGRTVQLALEDDDADDYYSGVGWFHVLGVGKVSELCPLKDVGALEWALE